MLASDPYKLAVIRRNMQMLAVLPALRPHSEQFWWTIAAVASCCSVRFGLLSATTAVLILPWVVDSNPHKATGCGAAIIAVCAMRSAGQSELLVISAAVAVAVYVCCQHERKRDAEAKVEKAADEIAALKREEEDLKAQIEFQRFRANPLTSQHARTLIAKLQEATKPKTGLSGDLQVAFSKDEEEDESVVHSKTEVAILQVDIEEGHALESVSSFSDLPKAELSSDDLKYLLRAIVNSDFVAWTTQQRRAVADMLATSLDQRNVLSQKLQDAVGASHKVFRPASKTIRVTDVLRGNAEFATVLRDIGEWDFDTLATVKYTKEPLKEVGCYAFTAFSLMENFQIKKETLLGFMVRMEIKYRRTNYYHNSLHAADVLNSALFLLMTGLYPCGQFLEVEVFGLLVAAIGHDVGHPGVNNTYLINAQDPVALKYNDKSVLEQMHSALTFQILEKNDSCITAMLTAPTFRVFRKVVVQLILSTDLQKHISKQKEFEAALADSTKNLSDASFRLIVLEMCLICADLGHGAKSLEIHKRWSCLITKELFLQGEMERKHGLPLSPICDKETIVVSKSQLGFLSFLVVPLFELWEKMLEKLLLEPSAPAQLCTKQARNNVQFWSEEFKRFQSGFPTFVVDEAPPPLHIAKS